MWEAKGDPSSPNPMFPGRCCRLGHSIPLPVSYLRRQSCAISMTLV